MDSNKHQNMTPAVKLIYWFAYYNLDSPSVRYRAKYPLEYLRDHEGLKFHLVTPGYKPQNIILFIRVYFSALFFRKPDSLIVIQRINSNRIYATLLKLLIRVRKRNTVYDLDDADYLEYPPATIYYFIKYCSAVSVGSHELRQNITRLNPHVFVNTSPTPDLEIIKTAKNEVLTIGWIGCFGGGHKESLVKSFFPALKDLPFKVKLILLGVPLKSEHVYLTNYFKDHLHIELEIPGNITWTNEPEIQQRIANFDIGIATLLDDELHRSKSAFKIKQYFNNGVPALSSDLPENNYFVDEGRNGFLCSTPADFRKRIIELHAMNPSEYMKLSNQARSSIVKFNLSAYGNKILTEHFPG